jgi:hypothetical protein
VLLAQVLQRQRGLHATLFDRPQVVRNPMELRADQG